MAFVGSEKCDDLGGQAELSVADTSKLRLPGDYE